MSFDKVKTIYGQNNIANPTLLTNEILVKSIHSSASGQEPIVDSGQVANKPRQGYDTLTQRHDRLLDAQSQSNQARFSGVHRFARTGMSTYATGPNDTSRDIQNAQYDSKHFFSRDVNRQILRQEPKYLGGGKYSIRKKLKGRVEPEPFVNFEEVDGSD